MKKLLIMLLVIAFAVACGGEEKNKTNENKDAVKKPALTDKLEQNVRAQLTKSNLGQVQIKVSELKKLDFMPGFSFVKIDLEDPATKRKQEQFFFTDGRYLVPDIIDSEGNQGLMDSYQFEYSATTQLDVSKLSLYYGNKDAKNIIVTVSDFQCPYCKQAHAVMAQILQKEKKDVAVYFMHMPLPFHKKAVVYAKIFEAGLAMGQNFADQLYGTTPEDDKKSDEEIIAKFASLVTDAAKFRALIESPEIAAKIEENSKLAQELGVRGTPHIFFNGKTVNGFKPGLYEHAVKTMK